MSDIAALPPSLRHQIMALAQRIRWLRAVRGGSLLLSVLLLTASAAFVSDYCLGLPAAMRLLFLIAWAGVGIALGILVLFLPLCRPLSPQALAALIEERHPDLGERLTSAIEVASNPGKYHGSPALVALLIEEAETRTSQLNFLDAVPSGTTVRLAAVATVLFLAAGSCVLLWPRHSVELGRRFLLPWRTPGALVAFSLHVTPGDVIAAKGQPLTVTVAFVSEHEGVALPQGSTLVILEADGTRTRRAMAAERSDTFQLRVDKVTDDFRYCIEAGAAVSDTYQVTAVEPVELAADSPTITISPPAYAKKNVEEQTIHGLADVSALQYSRVRFDFRFTRPARMAALEWPSPGANEDHAPSTARTIHPLTLTADRCGASAELPALVGGEYRVLLEEEHGIRTDLEPRIVNVKIDQPPAFVKVVVGDTLQPGSAQAPKPAPEGDGKGSEKDAPKLALPFDSVPVDVALTDDVGIGRADVEYRINDGPSQSEPIPLHGAEERETQGQSLFKLAHKGLHEGDTLRYRIRAADNRHVPEAGLGPHTIYSPSDEQWFTLKIADTAQPLRQQEILSERDDIECRLREIANRLLQERRQLNQLRAQARRAPGLTEEQAQELKQLREQSQAIEDALRDLARAAAEIRPLQTLADQARETADQPVHRSEESLQQAEKENQAEPRDRRLKDADKEITAALRRVAEMRQANVRLTQARLDLHKLDVLADRQEQLAERAARDATKDLEKKTVPMATDGPSPSPASKPTDAQELQRDQEEIADELRHLAEQSETVRKALEAARAEQGRQLAARARELAQAERDLLEAAREMKAPEMERQRDELVRKQQALAERASQFAKETRSAAQAARAAPLKSEDAQRAAQALREDNVAEAVRLQQETRDELERLAKELDQASEWAREPREAARQLAGLQEALRQKLHEQEATERRNPAGTASRDAIRREQAALSRAVEELPVSALNQAARKQQRQAVERTTQAVDALDNHDARHAEARMAQATQALERLAEQLPTKTEAQKPKAPAGTTPSVARGQAPEPVMPLDGLPSHEQAKQARELAQQQSELSHAVQQMKRQESQANSGAQENPLGALAREQADVARQAEEMARDLNQDQGEQAPVTEHAQQAAQSARQTARQLQAGALSRAYQTGTQTAGEFHHVTEHMGENSRGSNPKTPDTLRQARQLNEHQEDLNRRMRALATNSDAQRAQQQARQHELQQETSDLNQDLNQLAEHLDASPVAQQSARRAAEAGERSQAAMQEAQENSQQGDRSRAQQAQREAALALDQVARQAEMAAQQMAAALDLPRTAPEHAGSEPPPGQELQQAQREMGQADKQLGQGRLQAAREAMRRASQALQQAARQLAQQAGHPNPNAQTSGLGVAEAGRPGANALGSDGNTYAGKRWGELPGELRTKLIQDIQARYGDEYARIIKLYFEQVADTNK